MSPSFPPPPSSLLALVLISVQQLARKSSLIRRPSDRTRDSTYTAISRKVVAKNVHATIPKGNMGYDQYTVPDTVAVEPTFVAFL